MAAPVPRDGAPPRRLLDLNGETLAAIFALAQREADEAYVAAYRVHAPQRMPLVCRTLRQLTLHKGKPVLLVPLLRADGATPLFFTDAEWTAYFDLTKRAGGDLHLVSPSPAAPLDVDAHLESLGLVAPRPVEPFLDFGDGFVVNDRYQPHVKHAPSMWSLVRCASTLRRMQLMPRVTALEVRMCFPFTLHGKPPSIAVGFPEDHFATLDWSSDIMRVFFDADHLRSLSVRLGGLPGMEAADLGQSQALAYVQSTLFFDTYLSIANALRPTLVLNVLRFDVEARSDNFDDFILHFLLQATTPLDGPQPWPCRKEDGSPSWCSLHDGKAPSAVVPIRVQRVQLTHAGTWHEEHAVPMMALMGVERFELLGARHIIFDANTYHLPDEAFLHAAERRTTPMTFLCADYVLDPPLPAWLTVETRGA